MKSLTKPTLLAVVAASAFSAHGADSITTSIAGSMEPSGCDISVSSTQLNLGTYSFYQAQIWEQGGAFSPAGPTDFDEEAYLDVTPSLTITYTCDADTTISAKFEDAIPASADAHSTNNIFGSEVPTGFTLRDTENNAVGIVALHSWVELPVALTNGTFEQTNYVHNNNKVSRSDHAQATMGPIDVPSNSSVQWRLEARPFVNARALNPAEETQLSGSIEVQLEF